MWPLEEHTPSRATQADGLPGSVSQEMSLLSSLHLEAELRALTWEGPCHKSGAGAATESRSGSPCPALGLGLCTGTVGVRLPV